MIHLCTLFDSNYLDRGLTMYHSLEQVCPGFHLYVFAFDSKCYEVLVKMHLPYMTVISLEEFETPELLAAKPKRTRGEYCWTCSSFTIAHVLTHYHVDYCTYIDADMFFYNDPTVLLDEIIASDCQVSLVRHQFGNNSYSRHSERLNGKYCVQFNTFRNTPESMHILSWWGEQCLNDCNSDYSNGNFGDQKYLNDWTTRFSGVHEIQHLGAGVANWNLYRYQLKDSSNLTLYDKVSKTNFSLIFFHFHGLSFNETTVNTGVYTSYGSKDKNTVDVIYSLYLKELLKTRKFLSEKYGCLFSQTSSHADEQPIKTTSEKIEEKKQLCENWGFFLMVYTVLKSHFNFEKDFMPLSDFMEN